MVLMLLILSRHGSLATRAYHPEVLHHLSGSHVQLQSVVPSLVRYWVVGAFARVAPVACLLLSAFSSFTSSWVVDRF
jgi:hypothetical protein